MNLDEFRNLNGLNRSSDAKDMSFGSFESKENPNLDFQNILNYFLTEKSDYCATMMSAQRISGLKEISDMWVPQVSGSVHGRPSLPPIGSGDRWTVQRGR